MNPLTEKRAAVAAVLEDAGIRAAEYVAESLTAPAAVVVPSQPYLEWVGNTFGDVSLNVDVLLVVGRDANKATAQRLDELLVTAVAALHTDHPITRVSRPGFFTLDDTKFFGVALSLADSIPTPEATP